jgi:signal transduction histidine kinase
MLGTVVDITERKRLEAELRHHAEELERILESIGEGFVALDGDFRYVYVNRAATRLQQVFWNLLTNAVKFTDQGGRIVASLRREGAYVVVSVSDSGVGISPDLLSVVFEPFRQAEARLGRGQGGLGLGLAISRQLVELHGGTIQATSDGLGQGGRSSSSCRD